LASQLRAYSNTRKCSRRKRTSSAVGVAVARSSAFGDWALQRESQKISSMLDPLDFSEYGGCSLYSGPVLLA
jgi:hypothetical protein